MFHSNIDYVQTNDEKLDYIYRELKKTEADRKWSLVWKWFWRAVMIISLGYLYYNPMSIFDMLNPLGGGGGGSMSQLQQLQDQLKSR